MSLRRFATDAGRALAAGLFLALAPSCGSPPAAPLRIGISPWPVYEFLYLAQEKGYFEAEGARIRLVEMPSLNDTRRAFERGQLDGLVATPVEALLLRDRAARAPRAVLVLGYSQGADAILARAGVDDLAALRGKRVGIEPGSTDLLILARALESVGLPMDAVKRVSMDPIDMPAALAAGKIDAAVSYPPFLEAIRAAGAHPIFDTRKVPRELLDLLLIDPALVPDRIDDVAGMVRAFERAVQWAMEHPVEAGALMAQREGVTPAQFAQSLREGIFVVPLPDQDGYLARDGTLPATLGAVDRVLRSGGWVQGPSTIADATTLEVVKRARRD